MLRTLAISCALLYLFCAVGVAQESTPGPGEAKAQFSGPVIFSTQQDHDNMMVQLGITRLRTCSEM